MLQQIFEDDTMRFETELALGQVRSGLSEPGEVLATVAAIEDGDRPSWVAAWSQLASRLEQAGDEAERGGHPISARDLWLRASNAWNKASFLADGGDDPAAMSELWGRHRRLWERAAPRLAVPAEAITVPFEGHDLEAFLWRPAPGGPPRRTLVMNNGSDGPVTDMWYLGAADALERGWNVVTFDGPGQNSTLHRLGIGFRPDWHVVIAAVLDRLAGVPEVDPERVALLGNSQGGYWAPQAATVEHRLAAVVADPGVVDVSVTWFEHLPPDMAALLDDPDGQAPFDELMAAGMAADANLRATIRVRARPFCIDSLWNLYRSVRSYRLDAEAIARITCPVAVTSPDDEQFWPGQSDRLLEALRSPATRLSFTADEGAAGHCEPLAPGLRNQRILDWLDEVVSPTA